MAEAGMFKETLSVELFDSLMEKIKKWIDNTDPDSVRRAGNYYLAAQTLLEKAARELKGRAVDLAEHYGGPASVTTQKQLQFLHATIRELADEMGRMGPPLHQYADTLVWAQQNLVVKRGEDSRSDHDTDWADMIPGYGAYRVEDRARDHFYKVNERIAEHYALLPDLGKLNFLPPTSLEIPDFKAGGFSPGGFPGGATGSGSPYGSGGPGDLPGSGPARGGPYDPISPALDTNGAGGPNGEGADSLGPDQDVWGSDPVQPGGSSGPSGLGGSGGLGGPGGSSALDGLDGLDRLGGNGSDPSAGLSDGVGVPVDGGTRLAGLNETALSGPSNALTPGLSANGAPGIGASGIGTSGIGTSGDAGTGGAGTGGAGLWGAGGAGALSGSRGGMNGMPMMPYGGTGHGQGGEKGQEHENSTGLLEDDEVWGSGGSTTPPLLT